MLSDFERSFTDKNYCDSYFNPRADKRNIISYRTDLFFVRKLVADGKSVLDYGCGEMVFTNLLEKYFKTSVFDPSSYINQSAEYLGKEQYTESEQYDLIILRGVLQHLPDPFVTLRKISNQVSINGKIIFLATPNTSSPYYFLNSDLPALDPPRNFWVPSITELRKVMLNLGFIEEVKEYPYLKSGYAKPINDHILFLINLFGIKRKYAFWRSMMNVSFKKCTSF